MSHFQLDHFLSGHLLSNQRTFIYSLISFHALPANSILFAQYCLFHNAIQYYQHSAHFILCNMQIRKIALSKHPPPSNTSVWSILSAPKIGAAKLIRVFHTISFQRLSDYAAAILLCFQHLPTSFLSALYTSGCIFVFNMGINDSFPTLFNLQGAYSINEIDFWYRLMLRSIFR